MKGKFKLYYVVLVWYGCWLRTYESQCINSSISLLWCIGFFFFFVHFIYSSGLTWLRWFENVKLNRNIFMLMKRISTSPPNYGVSRILIDLQPDIKFEIFFSFNSFLFKGKKLNLRSFNLCKSVKFWPSQKRFQ